MNLILKQISHLLLLLISVGMFNSQRVKAQSIVPAADGTGTIVIPDGNRYNIEGGTLSGDGANLFQSFQQFGLTEAEIANFLSDPNIRNILGRVIGGDASLINGLIQVSGGNSNLFLLNPAGFVFGNSAQLNLPANFTVTTADGIQFGSNWFSASGLNNYQMLVGNPTGFAFTMGQPGVIVNAGNLNLGVGQDLMLLGGVVVNTGQLSVPEGEVLITAVPGQNLVRVSLPGRVLSLEIDPIALSSTQPNRWTLPILALPDLLTVGGSGLETRLTANGNGTVQLTNSEVIVPTQPGTVIVSGKVDVSGQRGGNVGFFGDRVGLVGAEVNASGINGGGTVLIGGDYKGQGRVPNATRTFIDQNSAIKADALLHGNGGQVIVWANQITGFYGNISVRGGRNFGNGGFVEVSGQEDLIFRGSVNLNGEQGKAGTLLLDPENIRIVNGSGAVDDGQVKADNQILFDDLPGDTFTISETTLECLAAGANVLLEATNDIIINNLRDNKLTFAPGPGGSIRFTADADGNNIGLFSMDASDTIRADARSVTISGASLTLGLINTATSKVLGNFNGVTHTVNINGGPISLTATNGPIRINGVDGNFNSLIGSSITINTPSTLSVAGSLNARSDILGNAGDITIGNSLIPSSITVGDGGVINITAGGDIITAAGVVSDSLLSGNGGSISLSSQGDIQVSLINAQGSSTGRGGNIDVVTEGFFRATGMFTDQNGVAASISTAGGAGSGTITINHGGGLMQTPFVVGDGTLNGTAGAITTRGDNIISPIRSFVGNYVQDDIRIITPSAETNSEVLEKKPELLSPPGSEIPPLDPDRLVYELEEYFTRRIESYVEQSAPAPIKTLDNIQNELKRIEESTDVKSAIIYVFFPPRGTVLRAEQPDVDSTCQRNQWDVHLQLIMVTSDHEPIREFVPGAMRSQVKCQVEELKDKVQSEPSNQNNSDQQDKKGYLTPASQLYQWLVAPIEDDLKKQGINNLVFVMDEDLLALPLAVLHDGNKYLLEKGYSVGFTPSMSLTDARYVDIKNAQVLAMGSSKFERLDPLPSVETEIKSILKLWQPDTPGELSQYRRFLNENFTVENILSERSRKAQKIVHLATHAAFLDSENYLKSYIHFWGQEKLTLDQVSQLELDNPLVELLVLSACETSLGNKQAELGFAGLTRQAGVKSVLGNLWLINDAKNLGLITQFYHHLKTAPIKAEALRLAQLAMLSGQVKIENGRLVGPEIPDIPLPRKVNLEDQVLSHPYYWSSFTMVGNPW